jgi:short-subunit dehydrogenase
MFDFADKTVLITGGSTGIGAEFARQLAARRARLVLVARRGERLRALGDELRAAHGIAVEGVAADLARPGAAARLGAAVQALGLGVDVLINNAGFGSYGAFDGQSRERQREQIDLNVGALVELTHEFLPGIERAGGGVIHVASTAAFQPVPYMAVYGATKAFVLSFSEALWAELRPRGVRVLALCPGATDTPFFDVAGANAAVGQRAAPADVVRAGLAAFARGKSYVVPGTGNFLVAQAARLLPRQAGVRLTARIMRPSPVRPILPAH